LKKKIGKTKKKKKKDLRVREYTFMGREGQNLPIINTEIVLQSASTEYPNECVTERLPLDCVEEAVRIAAFVLQVVRHVSRTLPLPLDMSVSPKEKNYSVNYLYRPSTWWSTVTSSTVISKEVG
jgi:hypothetical protein